MATEAAAVVVPAEEVVTPTLGPARPFAVNVAATAHSAFQQAVVLAQAGYTFSDAPIEITPNGWAFFQMIHAAPNAYAIQEAQKTVQISVNEEAAKYKKDVEAAAKAIFEEAKRAELERDVAAATAALEEQIATLKRAAAAELAQLQNAAAAEMARLK
jgi:hypothetical protein